MKKNIELMKNIFEPDNETGINKMKKIGDIIAKIQKIRAIILFAVIAVVFLFILIFVPLSEDISINERLSAIGTPIPISSEDELKNILSDRDYILSADITLSADWKGIGTIDSPFCGSLSGNGYTINTAAASEEPNGFPGLVRYAADGCILQNVVLDDCYTKFGGAFIAKILGENGTILLYKCELKGDELPYYYIPNNEDIIMNTNFCELQVIGVQPVKSTCHSAPLICPEYWEQTDHKLNTITFYDCEVETMLTNQDVLMRPVETMSSQPDVV